MMKQDPDFLNAELIDQIKWVMTKPAGNRCRLPRPRKHRYT